MKVVILAGGYGTRLMEETIIKPKPMVEIGGRPMLWHIMNVYASYGYKEFVIALGYKGDVIKHYFLNQYNLQGSLTVNLSNGNIKHVEKEPKLDWIVHLIETGVETNTAGRLMRLKETIGDSPFMMTYGDGVADIDIAQLVEFHKAHGETATVTSVRPPARFGVIDLDDNTGRVDSFGEKPQIREGWINGGFFVLEPSVFDYLDDEQELFERAPLQSLVLNGELYAYRHEGFWQCMDTLRDVRYLEELWSTGAAPWKKNWN